MNIFEKLKEKGYETIPAEFYTMVSLWKSWYDGDVASFHNYKVFNGQKQVRCKRHSLGMAKKVAEDWANLLLNEKVKITLEGEKEQAFFDDVCRANNFRTKANEMQEMKSAYGTAAYIPRAVGVEVNAEDGVLLGNATAVKIDYVTADHIFPLSWENGIVTECAFADVKSTGDKKYLYLQIHTIGEDGNYVIENAFYEMNNEQLTEVSNKDVRGYERVPERVLTGSKKRQFVIDRLNIANNVDVSLPMGIPAFANAIDCLKGVDVAYDSYVNEFVLGKKRIIVKPEATKSLDGNPYFDENDLTFYVLPEDGGSGNVVEEIDMNLRTEAHSKGIQDMLNALSSKCGFGENHYKYDRGSIATATQIVSENSTLFRTLKKHEILLEDVLVELCRIILRMGNTYMNAGLNEEVEVSIDFDDSIIEDKATEFSRDMQMMNAGVLNDWEFRAKWMNEDVETAKISLPRMEDMTTEPQREVE